MHCTTRTLISSLFTTLGPRQITIPSFLLPSFNPLPPSTYKQTAPFSSTSAASGRRKRKDGNPDRGISALRRTGLNSYRRRRLIINPTHGLPTPVLDVSKRTAVEIDPDHGLWEFFPPQRSTMATPAELGAHGRAWTVPELRHKDWDDLHRLWWVCIKELNRLGTYKAERERVGNMYGDYESDARSEQIRLTMRAIKHALTERWYAWENARVAAMEDEEVDLYADLDQGQRAYFPRDGMEVEGEAGEVNEAVAGGSVPIPPPPALQSSEART